MTKKLILNKVRRVGLMMQLTCGLRRSVVTSDRGDLFDSDGDEPSHTHGHGHTTIYSTLDSATGHSP